MGVKRGDLKVAVIEARSLPNKSRVKGRQDVFVELKIEGVAYRTRTVKDAGSAARFDEELTVNIVDSRRVLEITVFKPGHLGGDAVPIGDFTMDFGEVIAGNKEASSYNGWVDLNEKKPSSQEKGQLLLEFTYVPFRRQTLQTPAVPGKDRPLQPLPIPPPKQGAFHPPPAGYPPVPSPPREQPSTLPGTFPLDATP
ncbi:MAG: C2 domain-containing protein, partial [Olpidium bornovanus]